MEFLKTLANEMFNGPAANGNQIHTSNRQPFSLSSPLNAVHAAVVMEMLSDELEVLSATFGASRPELRTAESVELAKENRPKLTVAALPSIKGCVQVAKPCEKCPVTLTQQYTTVIPRRMLQGLHETRYWTAEDLPGRMAAAKIKTDTEAGKCQRDRIFLMMVADNTLRELLKSESFSQLNKVVEAEKNTLRGFWHTCLKIQEMQTRMKILKGELRHVQEDKWVKMAELDREIFKQNDQLLELSRRSDLEAKFVDRQIHMILKRFKRAHRHAMKQNHDQTAEVEKKRRLELNVYNNIVFFLKYHIEKANGMLTYWQDKYETDLHQLMTAIDEMVDARKKDRERSEYIYKVIARHEPIVIEDRRLKAIEAEKKRKTERQNRARIRLQAWWRGTMVRKQFGPFSAVFYYLKHPERAQEEKSRKAEKAKKKKK